MQRLGGKVPGYAASIVKESEDKNHIEGMKKVKGSEVDHLDDFENESMFDGQSEIADEIPEKVQIKLDKQDDTICRINLELKVKNEKIIELMVELDEIKIQIFARDKSIELQQKQIEDLLEELRETKGYENDLNILMQKKMALENENDRLKEELNRQYMQGVDGEDEQQDMVLINNGLHDKIKLL